MEAEREVVGSVMSASDIDADVIEIEGVLHRRVLKGAATYMTAAREVRVERWLYKDRRNPEAHDRRDGSTARHRRGDADPAPQSRQPGRGPDDAAEGGQRTLRGRVARGGRGPRARRMTLVESGWVQNASDSITSPIARSGEELHEAAEAHVRGG